jgi:uridine phosphorylase
MLLVERLDGNRSLGRPRCAVVVNIKMDLGETVFIWLRIGTSGGLLCYAAMKLRVP